MKGWMWPSSKRRRWCGGVRFPSSASYGAPWQAYFQQESPDCKLHASSGLCLLPHAFQSSCSHPANVAAVCSKSRLLVSCPQLKKREDNVYLKRCEREIQILTAQQWFVTKTSPRMEGQKAHLQEAVKLAGDRDARDRRTPCKGVNFHLVMR